MKTTAIVCVMFIAVAIGAAQPPGGGRPFERIERFKKMRMVEMLDLKEEQSVRFFARLNEMENQQRELHKQRDEALDKLERLIRNNADASEYGKIFDEIELVQRKLGEHKLSFFKSLTDILTIEQQAKLVLFERRFEQDLRDAVRETQQRRRRFGDSQ